MPLTPVFGLNVSGGLAFAPLPAVLQFPGVPQLSGNFGASLGLEGISVSAGGSLGFGGISANAGINLGGGVAGGINIGGSFAGGGASGITGGISGTLPIPGGGISGGVSLGPGGISGNLSGGIGPFQGNIGIGPDGITGSVGVSMFGISLSASLAPMMTEDEGGGFEGPSWGVFDKSGEEVCTWESVLKVDYRHEMRVSDFPIEDGDFASYNKVQVPYDARITFVAAGESGVDGRRQLLVDLEEAVQSLDLYSVVTPEATYRLANLTHMDYSRETRRGVSILVVEVWLQEIRLTATQTTATPQSPTADTPKNAGQTQAKTVQPAIPEAQRIPQQASPQPSGTGSPPDRAAPLEPQATPPPSLASDPLAYIPPILLMGGRRSRARGALRAAPGGAGVVTPKIIPVTRFTPLRNMIF